MVPSLTNGTLNIDSVVGNGMLGFDVTGLNVDKISFRRVWFSSMVPLLLNGILNSDGVVDNGVIGFDVTGLIVNKISFEGFFLFATVSLWIT
ncbi:hypothetical protein NDU88_006403 [Pleurodeles waltl]|uniref:Uncharacterized protein n=1 Tax=Pleurodeles waltl TaxID=8319 RepID=A0AAV7U022_PLEWA|nr:hypothetical protein NDU88_006403 [Pleurodeles waltl]